MRGEQFEWRTVLEPLIAFDSILRRSLRVFAERRRTPTLHLRVAEWQHADQAKSKRRSSRSSLRRIHRIPKEIPSRRRTMTSATICSPRACPAHPAHRLYLPIERLRSFLRLKEDFYIRGIFTLLLFIVASLPWFPICFGDHGALLLRIAGSQGGVDLVNNTLPR